MNGRENNDIQKKWLEPLVHGSGELHYLFDKTAVDLVRKINDKQENGEKNLAGFVPVASRDEMFDISDKWTWMQTLVTCMKTHLKHSAAYHQFFRETPSVIKSMDGDLEAFMEYFEQKPTDNLIEAATKMLQEMRSLVQVLKQFEARVNQLWKDANKLMLVDMRVDGIKSPHPAVIMADYENDEGEVREGENVLLVQNNDNQTWIVKNGRGQEINVPALIVLIPGPHRLAIDMAVEARFHLLAYWTQLVKLVGLKLIRFLLMTFKAGYEDDEINLMRALSRSDKREVTTVSEYVVDTMKVLWGPFKGFILLQERISTVMIILDGKRTVANINEEVHNMWMDRAKLLQDRMDAYKELFNLWQLFKVSQEFCRLPEYMLILTKWEQLKYVKREDMLKQWLFELDFGNDEHGFSDEDLFTTTDEEDDAEDEESGFGAGATTTTALTEQFSNVKGEIRNRYVIKSVLDPISQQRISLDQAKRSRVLDLSEGVYVDATAGTKIPISQAMDEGRIAVEYVSPSVKQEKTSTYGIITIKSVQQPMRKFRVVDVKDTAQQATLSQGDASQKGILDEKKGKFRDTARGRKISITDAIDRSLINVEYEEEEPKALEVSQNYAVRKVLDKAKNRTVSFQEAVNRGIIREDSGMFYDTLEKKDIPVDIAIMKGYLKATKLKSSCINEMKEEEDDV